MTEDPPKVARALDRILAQARGDAQVLAAALYGSHARADARPDSDIDVCLMLEPARYEPLALSEKKLQYLALTDADVQVFQQLPLYIRHDVLMEAKFLFVRDEDGSTNWRFARRRRGRIFGRTTAGISTRSRVVEVDDAVVYKAIRDRLSDFGAVKRGAGGAGSWRLADRALRDLHAQRI